MNKPRRKQGTFYPLFRTFGVFPARHYVLKSILKYAVMF